MEIVKADILGFCFGVRRAVEIIETELEENGPLYTLGAIVHNTHVVEELAKKGAKLVHSLDEVPKNKTVAITAHGAGEDVCEEIRSRDLRLVDTTCTIVRRAQQTAAALVKKGFFVVVYGDKNHPEVKGILSWTGEKGIASLSPAVTIPGHERRIAVIAQTTKEPKLFNEFVRQISNRYGAADYKVHSVDTTCPETGRRYQAAKKLATRVDLLFVVGSRNSANTLKLAETCNATGVPTHHIESEEEIEPHWLTGVRRSGVTAGASTPTTVIDEVVQRLQSY